MLRSRYLRGVAGNPSPSSNDSLLGACLVGPASSWRPRAARFWSLLTLRVEPGASLVLTRVPQEPTFLLSGVVNAVILRPGLFRHRFMAIAEQMGERLRLSSRSVNIRERLDFSCALFNQRGELSRIPYIPVHLGSMGESVKDLLGKLACQLGPLEPGDTFLTTILITAVRIFPTSRRSHRFSAMGQIKLLRRQPWSPR